MKKNNDQKWYYVSDNDFELFARKFREWFVILPLVAFQFIGIELFLMNKGSDVPILIHEIAFYLTVFSLLFLLYSSVACRSFVRSGRDGIYRKRAVNNLWTAIVMYFLVLLFLTVLYTRRL
jgi:hypothetical protein